MTGRASAWLDEAGEVRRLREGVADVEHAPLAGVPREAPRNLECPFVASCGRLQLTGAPRPTELRRACSLGCGERERAVEQRNSTELFALDELLQQAGARERACAQLRKGSLAPLGLGLPPKDERPNAIHELLVRSGGCIEPCVEVALHGARL